MADKEPSGQLKKTNCHAGHRKRMKEQFLAQRSLDWTPDHNVLELLLFYGIPRKDTNELAHNLIYRFGSFDKVFCATHEELLSVKGMTERAATLIEMILPLYGRYSLRVGDEKVSFPLTKDLINYLREQYNGDSCERVLLMCFDPRVRFINTQTVCMGKVSSRRPEMRRIAEIAIEQHASTVILAHNQLRGTATLSKEEIEATQAISVLLRELGVTLIDHIVISGKSYFAMSRQPHLLKHLFGKR